MFSRLWRWARPKKAEGSEVRASEPLVAAHSAPERAPSMPTRELFFEELAREAEAVPGVPAEREPVISEVVMQVVDYLARKKVEPPVMPALVPRVLSLVNEPEVNIVRLAQLIEQDLAISAKLISVANSPAFGGSIEVKTVRKAIAHLGTEQVAQVAIGLACASTYESRSEAQAPTAARWARLFQHGMTSAFAASHLAALRGRDDQESAFLGGLFHDVGKAVALRALEALAKAGTLVEEVNDLVVDEVLHRVHAYPGEEFYGKWTLPDTLMTICAQHHQLDDVSDEPPGFYYVSLASSFDALMQGSAAERRDALGEARVSADRLGLSEAELRTAYIQTRAFAERSRRMFGS